MRFFLQIGGGLLFLGYPVYQYAFLFHFVVNMLMMRSVVMLINGYAYVMLGYVMVHCQLSTDSPTERG